MLGAEAVRGEQGRWTDLSSQNERVVKPDDQEKRPTDPARWAELASNRERLLDASDPLFQAGSRDRTATGMRFAAGAA